MVRVRALLCWAFGLCSGVKGHNKHWEKDATCDSDGEQACTCASCCASGLADELCESCVLYHTTHTDQAECRPPSKDATKEVATEKNATEKNATEVEKSFPIDFRHVNVWWVHTPKTGSSFCLTLQHEWCRAQWPPATDAELYDYRGCSHAKGFACAIHGVGHGPVPTHWDTRAAVIVVRDPYSRILSAFSDGRKHVHMHGDYWKKVFEPSLKSRSARRCDALLENETKNRKSAKWLACEKTEDFMAYASSREMLGCVARTLTGRGCSQEDANVTLADSARAVERLETFKFVGVHEDWNTTIESFHAVLGYPKSTLGPFDFAHLRITQSEKKPVVPDAFKAAYADPYDQPIYDAAVALYCRRFRVQRLGTPRFGPCATSAITKSQTRKVKKKASIQLGKTESTILKQMKILYGEPTKKTTKKKTTTKKKKKKSAGP